MSTVIVTLADGTEQVYEENTFGHQIGNGAVQIMLNNGGQEIYNNFQKVIVVPNAGEQADFEKQIEEAEERAKAQEAARQAELALQEAANEEGDGEKQEVAH